MSLTIATWNINGIKARIDSVLAWLSHAQPDVVALQEIKSVNEGFPTEAFESLGYNVAVHGQKSFNGVAILSKRPLEDVSHGLPGDEEDLQSRLIESRIVTDQGAIRVVGIYLPNGNPVDTEKFAYKLKWMERLNAYAKIGLDEEEPLIIIGDYNIIPRPQDCHAPKDWWGDAAYRPESRKLFRELKSLGFTDAFEACDGQDNAYSFWDYQAGAWPKNNGIRIDHILMSPQATDLLEKCWIERDVRGQERPSDHVPVCANFAL